ncbi:hypothetical protein NQD34_010834 [Periophthalmus magnuspinnatus]|uniref:Tetraspanin n=1 Tax=Periophthalmus magnuspinnatus TaxID=409849 RepID=A0A3B3Z6A7_9GOBI|nr:tetraspanin-14 isoform X1 [Periophthalmus magnuspinnatus]KAJ0004620.1 hypothetical protein NQD34_010834 [Periophthalmus magnuspinnatus]
MYYYRYENAEVSCCYKYLMFSYNIVFWLLGAALIAAGLWAWSEKGVLQDLSVLTRIHGFDPVWALLVAGVVMFVLGFAGCVGALRENLCLLKAFSSMVGLIFFLEVLAVVLVLVFQSQVFEWIQTFFMRNIRAYRDDIDLQNLIDSLQTSTWCCGAQGPEDWEHNPYFSCNSTNASRERCGVPFSCCVLDPAESVVNSQCGYDVRKRAKPDWSEQIHTRGCISALEQWVPGNLYTVALVFVIVSVLQMLGIYLARSLITDIYKVQINHIRNPVY